MKLKSNFITHEVANEHLTVPTSTAKFSGIIRSNKTAAFIIEKLKKETTPEEITEALCAEFEADYQKVLLDVVKIIDSLREIGAIDE